MQLCSITPGLTGDWELRVYDIDHAADSGALKLSPGWPYPNGSRAGASDGDYVLRWPPFQRLMVCRGNAELFGTKFGLDTYPIELGSAMTHIFRDNLSLRQGTKWSAAISPGANKLWAMVDDDQTQRLYNDGLRARTKALRKAKGFTYRKMALYLGGIECPNAYKKYRRGNALPDAGLPL